ncbi:P-loop containing nucleoside triphosphate hydrolase protein [Gorgonomyces haynaldii]|nr:P-loop containing nucleoside triphosphate hydrolase protein [Gorgonomyces haynaldii]
MHLFPHQIEGVKWLNELYALKRGGLLSDDMGLGKTCQTIVFLTGLLKSKKIQNCLIMVPKTLLMGWKQEFEKWSHLSVQVVSKSTPDSLVYLTTYDVDFRLLDREWDYLVLDEGHRIKNPKSQITKNVKSLKSKYKLVLSGTVIQNDLSELWTLVDFCNPGLLGTYQHFKRKFEIPITIGASKDCTHKEKRTSEVLAMELRMLIKPYYLRREKSDLGKVLEPKYELALWIPLCPYQRQLYRQILDQDESQAFKKLDQLEKVCNHPQLLKDDELLFFKETDASKIQTVLFLLDTIRSRDEKTLIFSKSTTILQLLQLCLKNHGYSFCQLDGSITQMEERQKIINAFNDGLYDVCLLTSRMGVGITLTAANHVILYDLDWNPSIDAQAVDRAYRLGQTKQVFTYRLITCGTIEEQRYKRQVFKSFIGKTGMEHGDNPRYFNKNEWKTFFEYQDETNSQTMEDFREKFPLEDLYPQEVLDLLHQMWLDGVIAGGSSHDALYSDKELVEGVSHLSISSHSETSEEDRVSRILDSEEVTDSEGSGETIDVSTEEIDLTSDVDHVIDLTETHSSVDPTQSLTDGLVDLTVEDAKCKKHTSNVFDIERCSCYLTPLQHNQYKQALRDFKQCMRHQDYQKAYKNVTNARELCDEDARVHFWFLKLNQKLYPPDEIIDLT